MCGLRQILGWGMYKLSRYVWSPEQFIALRETASKLETFRKISSLLHDVRADPQPSSYITHCNNCTRAYTSGWLIRIFVVITGIMRWQGKLGTPQAIHTRLLARFRIEILPASRDSLYATHTETWSHANLKICDSYVYGTVHHLDSWIKRDQLDATCSIISLFNAEHVSDVNTSILRSLRLICWVISWVVLLWFDVCWC